MKAVVLLLLLAVAAPLMVGCGESKPRNAGRGSASAAEQGADRFGRFAIPSDRNGAVMRAASDYERTLLNDGMLTFSEYEAAALATFKCIEIEGLIIVHFESYGTSDLAAAKPGPRLSGRGKYLYGIGDPREDPASEMSAVVENCRTQYFTTVEFLWVEHIAPSVKEAQEIRDFVAACVRAAGHSAPNHPSETELAVVAFPPDGVPREAPAPPWFRDCSLAAAEKFELG